MRPRIKLTALLAGIALFGAIVVALGASGEDPDRPFVASSATARQVSIRPLLLSDMRKPSEALPHGVPLSYDWARHPRVGVRKPHGFAAFTAWGQVYRCAGGTARLRRPIELRGLESWVFSRSAQRWRRLQRSSKLRGASFPEDFKGRSTSALIVRRNARGTAVRLRPGFNFHFWPEGPRARLSANDTQAVAVLVRARLRRSRAHPARCALVSVGGDYWRTATSPSEGFKNSADAGIGRFKRVKRSWRMFTMTTASAKLLRQHPLPVSASPSQLR